MFGKVYTTDLFNARNYVKDILGIYGNADLKNLGYKSENSADAFILDNVYLL